MTIPADTSKFKWVILDSEKAKKYNIMLAKLDEKGDAMLLIDIAYIPDGMDIDDYIRFLENTGIILNNSILTTKL